MAEREGFEPPDPFESMVFKTTAFDHSATSPNMFVFVNLFVLLIISLVSSGGSHRVTPGVLPLAPSGPHFVRSNLLPAN